MLKVMGVPFAGLISLFVALADLIPLVGATLGAVVATIAGFVHSVPAGIVVMVFFVVYQQLENHLLQPVILSRTVKLNPLAVLVAILLSSNWPGSWVPCWPFPSPASSRSSSATSGTTAAADPSSGRPSARTGHQWTPGRAPSRSEPPTAALPRRRPRHRRNDRAHTSSLDSAVMSSPFLLRSANFYGFPVAVRGSWSTNSTAFGTLKRAMRVCR